MLKLHDFYRKKIINYLIDRFNYRSVMQVPKIEKIVINVGIGKAVDDKKLLDSIVSEISMISGQKPLITKAKKSISGFKLRKGYPIGCKVTLRKKYMWEFLERLIFIAIPRIRDFRGFSKKSFDGYGNYNIGIREQIIFPEINYDSICNIYGLNISIITTAKSDSEGLELLNAFNFPFF